MTSRTLIVVLIAAAMATLCFAVTSNYVDVLDAPAVKSTLASKSLLNGLVFAGKRLVSVGQRGHIIYSDDRGKTWVQANVPVSSDLVAVHFPTPRMGWAVGHDGVVLHSSDGGVNWSKQFDGRAAAQVMAGYYMAGSQCSVCHGRVDSQFAGKPACPAAEALMRNVKRFVNQGPDKPFLDVWFESDTTGYIVGAFNLIFRTTDGGKVWEPWFVRTDNAKMLHLYAIRPVDRDLFICGEQGLVMKLDRQLGKFLTLKTPYNGSFFGVTGKPGTVLVYGLRGNVYRSRDGGTSWEKIETGVQVGLVGGAVTDDGRFVLVSQAGQVLVSADDGASFKMIDTERSFPATAVTALGKDTLIIAGLYGVAEQKIK